VTNKEFEKDLTVVHNGIKEISFKKLDFSNLNNVKSSGPGVFAAPASTTSRKVYEEE
jgi:hypothetical protein